MKSKLHILIITLAFFARTQQGITQGTAFTYQGQLNDINLELFNQPTNLPADYVAQQTFYSVAITNGLFSVMPDFGPNVFLGSPYWLQVSVSTNGVNYTSLVPLQELTPTPYSIYAETAGSVNNASITPSQLQTAGSPANGYLLGYQGGSLVWESPATSASSWGLTGNAGTSPALDYLGTTDGEPLELFSTGGVAINAANPAAGNPGNAAFFVNGSAIFQNGSMGIGTPSPQSELTVLKTVPGGRGAELSLVNPATSTVGNEVAINFGTDPSTYNGDSPNAQIKATSMNTDNRSDLIMSTWNGSSFGERMRIQSGGNVGIGTGNPTNALQVNGTVGANNLSLVSGGNIQVSGAGTNSNTAAFIQVATSANSYRGTDGYYYCWINNPLCNGNGNSILIVTYNRTPPGITPGTGFNHQVGVTQAYGLGGPAGADWAIYAFDNTPIPPGTAFNVLILNP